MWIELLGIVIEALASLLSEPASINILLQKRRRTVLAVTSHASVQHLHDSKTRVEADKVRKSERAHGNVGTELHGSVNVLTGRNALLENVNSLVNVRHKNAVRNETREILGLSSGLAHLSGQGERSVESLNGSTKASNNLDSNDRKAEKECT